MKRINGFVTGRQRSACLWVGAIVLVFASGAFAKTPDGMPPSQETVCSGLSGAAFGLCNAYCEAQDCDVHARPSCPVLRRNFEKLTGSPVFPCDRRCGNGTIDRGEDCDPPGSSCPDGAPCTDDCTCPEPICGNGTIDPGEDCDPPGSLCDTNVTCTPTCTCGTEPTGCCECPDVAAATCADGVTQSACQADGCVFGVAGSACDPDLGRCVPRTGNCCRCEDDQCFDVPSPDLCPPGCTAVPAPSMCDNGGNCQSFPVPVP